MDSQRCKLIIRVTMKYRFNRLSKTPAVNILLMIFALGLLAASFGFSLISNLASYYNYPGG
jgi:hypothetical protein